MKKYEWNFHIIIINILIRKKQKSNRNLIILFFIVKLSIIVFFFWKKFSNFKLIMMINLKFNGKIWWKMRNNCLNLVFDWNSQYINMIISKKNKQIKRIEATIFSIKHRIETKKIYSCLMNSNYKNLKIQDNTQKKYAKVNKS